MTELLRRARSEVRDFVDVIHVQVNTTTKEQVKLVTVKLVKLRKKLKVQFLTYHRHHHIGYSVKIENTVQLLFPTKFYIFKKRNILRTRL